MNILNKFYVLHKPASRGSQGDFQNLMLLWDTLYHDIQWLGCSLGCLLSFESDCIFFFDSWPQYSPTSSISYFQLLYNMICVFIHLFASLLILVGGTGDTALSTHCRVPPLLLEHHFQLKIFVAHHIPSYTKKYFSSNAKRTQATESMWNGRLWLGHLTLWRADGHRALRMPLAYHKSFSGGYDNPHIAWPYS